MIVPLEKRFEANKHLSLGIGKPEIPSSIREVARSEGLDEKEAMHISIVVTKNARRMWLQASRYENRDELYNGIEALFLRFAWEYELTDEYFLHERHYTLAILEENGDESSLHEHTRRSIVQKVVLPDLVPFYEQLNELLGTKLPTPVPHITLFTAGGRGIGISSEDDFKQFTKRVLKL